ncbi:hypothetical protein CGI16_08915 [Vibrio parahaemolyticus]|nr:hypothetical protein CGI82_04955 [Vibrio parahaemolyticus]TOK39958.1 hypothetical protein CGI19_00415 [Vibrio parahaemolyticus]TOK58729.1 hypothetical protein CGI16_08915 [Vibrio parahaemolyticus]TOO02059.1 hypothetical protein CGH44_21875 [Vibrio parahaemolyticus]TOO62338.1 hypothetical protein CGH33_01895 [Vibrio parahaemolyticus]
MNGVTNTALKQFVFGLQTMVMSLHAHANEQRYGRQCVQTAAIEFWRSKMKRASNSYRLQMIKEVVIRREREACTDPMARYIHQLMDELPTSKLEVELNHRFAGNHFDEQAGGWVSDRWSMK